MRTLLLLFAAGCSDPSLQSLERAPSSLLCGWYAKDAYVVGSSDAVLIPSSGAAVSWLGADPCEVEASAQCWAAGATLQLWARADTSGELDIERASCK